MPDHTTMTGDDVEIIDKDESYRGYFRLERYRLRHRTFAGGWTDEMTREVFERGHAVAVLPYDPERDEVVLLEQFRIGAYLAEASGGFTDSASPWLVECVAGIVERGESAEDVALREIVEEVGQEAQDLRYVGRYLVSPGGTTETIALYCARVNAEGAGGIHGLEHEHEDIRAFAVSAEDAFAMVADGRVVNATTIIALQWLQIRHAELRRAWRTGR